MSHNGNHPDPLDHLTVKQVAELTTLSKSTVERAIKAKQLHANHVGRRVLVPRAAAEEWLTGRG